MGASKEFLKGLLDNPNFKKWFGESAVRDAEGLPLEVYHGTGADFDAFSTNKGLKGIYVSKSPKVAAAEGGFLDPDSYQGIVDRGVVDSSNAEAKTRILPLFARINNPAKSADVDEALRVTRSMTPGDAKVVDYLRSKGFDGVMSNNYEHVVFSPEQLKSRFNQGTFGPTDPNFLKSAGLMTAGAGAAYGLARNNDGSMSVGPSDANAMSYIGPKGMANLLGPNVAKSMLSEAEQLAAKGVDNEAIRQATGVFKGMDGKWRYELDDSASQALRPQYPPNFMNQAAKEAGFGNYVDIPMAERKPINARADQLKSEYVDPFSSFSAMSNHLRHDDLYRAYPELADAPTRVDPKAKHQGVAYQDGRIEYGGGTILGGDDRSILLHELQHAIQQREGFARGGSPDPASLIPDIVSERITLNKKLKEMAQSGGYGSEEYKNLASRRDRLIDQEWELENPNNPKAAFDLYERLAGEIEARDTAKRMNFTPEQRMATPPDLRDNAIVRFDGNEAARVPAPAQAESPSAIQDFLATVLRGAKTVGNGIDSASKTLGPLVMNAPSRFATAAVNDPVGTASQVADFVVPFKGSAQDYADAFYHNQDATWLDKLNALAGIGLDAAFMGHGNQAKTALTGLMRY